MQITKKNYVWLIVLFLIPGILLLVAACISFGVKTQILLAACGILYVVVAIGKAPAFVDWVSKKLKEDEKRRY